MVSTTWQLFTTATLLIGQTQASKQYTSSLQRRYIDNSSGTPEVVIPGASSYNGLNLVPQMAWNNWNAYGCSINETILMDNARTLASFGLKDMGYNIISMDDCWSEGRNSSGYLVANPVKFPSGIPAIIKELNSMGFRFGMYSSAGKFTCGRYPGSLGYEQKDADLWASWGVEYIKYDNCFNEGQSGTPKLSFDRYNVMSQALNNTGKAITYAMCNWGNDDPYDWAYTIANSGRMSGDIYDSFNRPDSRCPCTEAVGCVWPGYHCSVMNIINKMPAIQSRTMSGYFNDMDMLEIGNGGQSDSEYVVHFSMWALLSSPLIIGTNVETLSPANLAIYSNPAIIAVNQDKSASAAHRVWRYFVDPDETGEGEISFWTRTLDNGDTVMAFLNAANTSQSMNATMRDIFLDQATAGAYEEPPELRQSWDIYDLWANRMSDDEAQSILNGNASSIATNSTTRYNATAMSYQDGLDANHTALFGTKVGRIEPSGTFSANISRHSVGVYRLRAASTPAPLRKRDEL